MRQGVPSDATPCPNRDVSWLRSIPGGHEIVPKHAKTTNPKALPFCDNQEVVLWPRASVRRKARIHLQEENRLNSKPVHLGDIEGVNGLEARRPLE